MTAANENEGTAVDMEALQAILKAEREENQKSMEALLGKLTEGAGEIDRSKVAKPGDEKREDIRSEDEPFIDRIGYRIDKETVAYGEAIHGRPVIERRYDSLPEDERKIRSFEGDLMVQRYLKALVRKDWESVEAIQRESLGHELVRAQSTTDAAGGYLAPAPLSTYYAALRSKRERIMPRSLQLVSESQTLSVTNTSDEGAIVAVTENAAPTADDHVFGTVALSKKKAGRLTYVSWELMNDQLGAFSIMNIISDATSRLLGAYWDGEFATGTYITDDLEGNGSIGSASLGGALTRKVVTDLVNSLTVAWRDGGGLTLMGNSACTGFLSELEDTAGRPLYQQANDASMPLSDVGGGGVTGVIEGMAYAEVPFAANILMVGRLSEGYAVLMDGGVRVDVDTSVGFAADQVAIRIMERRDGGVVQAAAFQKTTAVITAPA